MMAIDRSSELHDAPLMRGIAFALPLLVNRLRTPSTARLKKIDHPPLLPRPPHTGKKNMLVLRNMKVGARLAAGFGVLLLFIVAILAVVLYEGWQGIVTNTARSSLTD